jgi:uncharacterized protein involved in outer membrane biogenesis/outer membrane protein OmpA-like peptidoglycan-associated protein
MSYRPSRRSVVLAAASAAFLGAVIFLLPEIGRRIAIDRLENFLTVPVSIADIDLNLFTGRAAIKQLRIGAGTAPIASVPLTTVDFSRGALLSGRIDLQSVKVREPRLIVQRSETGSYNLTEAVRSRVQGEASGVMDFTLHRIRIEGGEIEFIDRAQDPDASFRLLSLDMVAGPISSFAESRAEPTQFKGGLRIADGAVRVVGQSQPLAQSPDADLAIEIDNVALEQFSAYLPYGARLDLSRSIVDGRFQYRLAHRDGAVAQHSIDGAIKVGAVSLSSSQGNQPVLQLSGLHVRDAHVDLVNNQAQVGALSIAQPFLAIHRDATGFNFQQFLPAGTQAETSAESGGPSGQISLTVARVEAQGGRIEFMDETVSPNVNTELTDLHIVAQNITVGPHFGTASVNAAAQLKEGSLRLSGAVQPTPVQGEFRITGEQLPFPPFRGYLNELFTAARSGGNFLNGEVKLSFVSAESGELTTTINGRLDGHGMELRFAEEERPFLRSRELGVAIRSIRLGFDPRVDIEQISFRGARLDFLREKDGSINLRRLWSSEDATQAEKRSDKSDDESDVTTLIRLISVQEGAIEIVDRSVAPNYETKVTQLTGKITDLLPPTAPARIDFRGNLGEAAKVQAGGWFTPFTDQPNMELKGVVRSYELPPLNPYATEYVNYRVRRGEITTEFNYSMSGGKVDGQAEVALRHVRLGERTGDEFIKRVGIPLDLALALLQDIQGVVRLQLALNESGGPSVDVSALIWNAVKNAIVRAITAPLRLVGNILTLGGRIGSIRIDPVKFQSGTRNLEAQSEKQLGDLAQLLKQKPRLELRLEGRASADEAAAIKERAFRQKIEDVDAPDYQHALVRVYRDLTGVQLEAPLQPRVEATLEEFIRERIAVDEEQLRQLAQDRAEQVEQALASRGVEQTRLRVSADVSADAAPQVEFDVAS